MHTHMYFTDHFCSVYTFYALFRKERRSVPHFVEHALSMPYTSRLVLVVYSRRMDKNNVDLNKILIIAFGAEKLPLHLLLKCIDYNM